MGVLYPLVIQHRRLVLTRVLYYYHSPGSMGPKIQAAIDFVQKSAGEGRTGAWASIGDLRDASKLVSNEEGTIIRNDDTLKDGVIWRIPRKETGDLSKKKESKEPHKSG